METETLGPRQGDGQEVGTPCKRQAHRGLCWGLLGSVPGAWPQAGQVTGKGVNGTNRGYGAEEAGYFQAGELGATAVPLRQEP